MASEEDVSLSHPDVTTIKTNTSVADLPSANKIAQAFRDKQYNVSDDDVRIDDDGTVTVKNQPLFDAMQAGTILPRDINLSPFCNVPIHASNVFCPSGL
jgi:hypothetical protein